MLKQPVFFFICFLMLPITGLALGLGDIIVFSKLNEPLKIHIELINSKATNVDEIIIRNASLNTYKRSNLPRPDTFNKVRFNTKKLADGSIIVELTSKRPVREPFITFIADLKWRSGHINREYTFLLDPPEFIQKQIRSGSQLKKEIATHKKSPTKITPAFSKPRKADHRKINYSSVIANHIDGNTYTTKRADTLWEIAKKVKTGKNVSTYRTMQALFALNPTAFINNNINLLKQGQTLQIPTQNEIRQINGQSVSKKLSTQGDNNVQASNSILAKQQLTDSANTDAQQQLSPVRPIANKDGLESQGQLKIIPTTEALLNSRVNSKKDLILITKALQNSISTIKSLKNDNEVLNQQIKDLTKKLNSLDRHNQSLNDKISEIGVQLNNQQSRITNSAQQQNKKQTNISSQGSATGSDHGNIQITDNKKSAQLSGNNTLKIDSRLTTEDKSSSTVREILTSPIITIVLAIFTLIILIATLFTIRNQDGKRKQKEHTIYDHYPEPEPEQAISQHFYPVESSQNNINIINNSSDSPKAKSQQLVTDTIEKEKDDNEEYMDFFEYFDQQTNAHKSISDKSSNSPPTETTMAPEASTAPEESVESEIEATAELTFDLDINTEDIDAFEKSVATPQDIDTTLSEIDTYLAYGNYNEAEERLLDELQKMPSDKNLHLKLFECYTYSNKRYEFIQYAKNNINLLRMDMVLRHRIENLFEKTWNETLDVNSAD